MQKNTDENVQEIVKSVRRRKRMGKLFSALFTFIIIASFGFFFLSNGTSFIDGLLSKKDVVTSDGEVSLDKDFATGLRLASLERYDEAISYFEKVNFNKLSEADQELVLMTYLYSGNEQKALDLKEEIDEEIIRLLLENDDLEKLKELETESDLIKFEIAVLDSDYETIIELKDTPRLEIDERRANAIANAYYQLGELENAINYTALMASSGINMWQIETKAEGNKNVSENKTEEKEEIKTPILGVIFMLVIVLLIAFGIYFVIINKETIKEELQRRKEMKVQRKIEKLQEKTEKKQKKGEEKSEKNSDYEEHQEDEIKTSTEDDKYSYHYEE